MFNDGNRRIIREHRKVADKPPCSIRIKQVVPGKFLALQDTGGRDAAGTGCYRNRRPLVRVFSVAQLILMRQLNRPGKDGSSL